MINVRFCPRICSLLLLIAFSTACGGQEKPRAPIPPSKEPFYFSLTPADAQIAEYVRHIFQDKNGNFWFGTNGYGVAHYDGENVWYFSNAQGFGGQQVTGITEDPEQNIWFATDQGVVKYDWSSTTDGHQRFTNYTDEPCFAGRRFWSVFADRQGTIWAGSATGIFRFDGVKWAPFALPYPEEATGEFITSSTTWSITEDRAGHLWFSTNGFGAFKHDGQSFTRYTEKDGLTDDHIDQVMEDRQGNIWFATRFGGVSRFDGERFVNFTQRNGSISNDEVCVIYEDQAGNIWMSSEGYGVYCYDGAIFTNYSQEEGLGVRAVQTIVEDREGRIWVGGGGGLYRLQEERFIHVTQNGPW